MRITSAFSSPIAVKTWDWIKVELLHAAPEENEKELFGFHLFLSLNTLVSRNI